MLPSARETPTNELKKNARFELFVQKAPGTETDGADVSVSCEVFPCQELEVPWGSWGEQFWGEFIGGGGRHLPSAGKWEGWG